MRGISRTLRAFEAALLAGVVSAILCSSAVAAPVFEVELSRDMAEVSRSDERVDYTAKIRNSAPGDPAVGATLTCSPNTWAGAAPISFSFQWLRNGSPLTSPEDVSNGSQTSSYTVQPADAGKMLQCQVKGTNSVSSALSYSVPAAVVKPEPSPPPPTGNARPIIRPFFAAEAGSLIACTAPTADWTGLPTAAVTAGSEVLTGVTTATGTGSRSAGSTTVSGVVMASGRFVAGQAISGVGIPAGTTVVSSGPGVLELSQPAASSGSVSLTAGAQPLTVGEFVGGTGIPTAAGSATLTAGSETVTVTPTASGAFVVGQRVTGAGIPAGTTVVAASGTTTQTLTLSAQATESQSNVILTGNTTITAIDGQTVTLSAKATATAATGTVWSAATAHWSLEWIRNGEPLVSGAVAPITAYRVQPGDSGNALQCRGTVSDLEGQNVVVASDSKPISAPGSPVNLDANRPTVVSPLAVENTTSGEITAELKLPAGKETYVFETSGTGWSCTAVAGSESTPAKAVCKRSDAFGPGITLPTFTVVAALGKDAPDLAVAEAVVSGGGTTTPATAVDQFEFEPPRPFEILSFETRVPDASGKEETRAGSHPVAAEAGFEFPKYRVLEPQNTANVYGAIEHPKTIVTETPPGFVGNVKALSTLCPGLDKVVETPSGCPPESMVGGIDVEVTGFGLIENAPVYAIEPEFGAPAQFAFMVPGLDPTSSPAYTFIPRLRPENDYAVTLESAPAGVNPELLGIPNVTLCSYGGKTSLLGSLTKFAGCKKVGDAGAYSRPLITLPTRCASEPPTTVARINTWENPDTFASKSWSAPPVTECEAVKFEPTIELQPKGQAADSPTGMDVTLSMPTEGFESSTGIAQANLKRVKVTLPEGMTVNAASAHGLSSCAPEQIQLKSSAPVGCPDGSKIGTVEATTPALDGTFSGNVYLAKQGANPFGSLLALYMVIDAPKQGILIKLVGKVTPNPRTGQLTVQFDENPQLPIEDVSLKFPQGPRAALVAPPRCGEYEIKAEMSAWNAKDPENPLPSEIVTQVSPYSVTGGPGGAPCPSQDLRPSFRIGSTNPDAGAASPFVISLKREDGSQRFAALDVTLPLGLTANLRGIPYCSDAALAGIPNAEGTGAAELQNPSCPAASQIGTAEAGAGSGPDPYYVSTGKVYLAGPYKGAPLSAAIVTPAVAGPFDLGNVVVRAALRVNPKTTQITAVSDPVPTILHGLPLNIREVRVSIDRPGFARNPTNCEPLSAQADVRGELGGTASASDRYQVAGCDKLGFAPKLQLRLQGGTKRSKYQKLTATLTARPGDANIAGASVRFPRSIFLAQEHIRTVCTRVQFAADSCPPGSIYGYAEAVTPLLDQQIQGPVYLRSSDNVLPDLVAALRGPDNQPIEVELVGRTDSKNRGIRNTFDIVPDAPVSSFTLRMRGGKKSLLVTSRDICLRKERADVRFRGQNGMQRNLKPVIQTDCAKKKQKKSRGGKKSR